MERITLIYKNVAAILKAGQIIEVPISLTDEMDVTAISLTCKYPNDLIEVVDITSDIVSENFLFSQLPPDQVRVSWFHQTPIKTFEIKIKCKVLADVPLGQELKFVAYEADQINKLNELAGWDYNPIEGVELHTVSLTQKATVAAKKAAQGYTGKPLYPKCSNWPNHDGVKRCTIGGFVVAKGGLCKLHPDLAK